MTIGGMTAQDNVSLELDKNSLVIIPKDADFSDTEASLSYELDENAPDHAIARILYEYQGHSIGQVYLCSAAHTQANTENISAGSQAPAAQTETGTAAPAETPEQKEIPNANARSSAQTRSSASKKAFPFLLVGICSAALIIVGVILFLLLHSHRKEKEDLLLRRKRRLERLEDIGYSSSDFDQLLSQKRSSTPAYKKQTHKVKRPRKKW